MTDSDSRFAISNQSDVEQLKKNSKKTKYFESSTDLVECLAELGDRRESQPVMYFRLVQIKHVIKNH